MPHYILRKQFRFEASHQLPKHSGKCQRLHGHSWQGEIVVKGRALDTSGSSTGMLLDYSFLKKVIEPLVEQYLDHHHLNDTTKLEDPTSENLARWIFKRISGQFPDHAELVCVLIKETCTTSCEYWGD